ncbi:hypothetical protein [Photorhabdus laumondii]|uniref:hypothetical protein n=1 Tax=Photorhabdus laumondii TaxID=2218628 RepID=UPI003315EE99
MTGVSECSQQKGNLKDNRYIYIWILCRHRENYLYCLIDIISRAYCLCLSFSQRKAFSPASRMSN